MDQYIHTYKLPRLIISFLLVCAIVLLSGGNVVRAEGELRLGLSQDSVLLEPGAAVTINITYYSDLPVRNVNVILNSTQAPGFSVQNVLSSSGMSVNGTGSLGSVSIIAPSTYANGNVVLSATAEDANDPAIKFTAQVTIPVTVNLPPPGEVDPNAPVAEGETPVPEETLPIPTQAGVNLALKLNGIGEPVNVNMSENTPGGVPEGYAEVVAEVQGSNIRTYKKAGRLPLIYVSLVENGAESLYSLDVENANAYRFYPDVYTEIAGKSAIITSLTEPSPDPSMVSESLEINGHMTTAWLGDIKGEEYTVIRAEIDGRSASLYRYAIGSDGVATLTPFVYADIINPPSPTPIPSTTLAESTEASEAAGSTKSGSSIDWFFWGLLLVFLLMLGGLVLLFLRSRSKRVTKDYRLDALHYDEPYQRKTQKKGIQLRELRPNDFDDVDRYFAERTEVPQRRNIDPAARSGVRRPQVQMPHRPSTPSDRHDDIRSPRTREAHVRPVEQAPRSRGQETRAPEPTSRARGSQSRSTEQRNPYRTYYKPQSSDYANQTYQNPSDVQRRRPNSQEPLVIRRVQNDPNSLRRHDEVLFGAEEHGDGPPYGQY